MGSHEVRAYICVLLICSSAHLLTCSPARARQFQPVIQKARLQSVFRIRDMLVRIRIRGTVPLTNGSGSGSGSYSSKIRSHKSHKTVEIKAFYWWGEGSGFGGGSQFGRLERKPGTLSTLCPTPENAEPQLLEKSRKFLVVFLSVVIPHWECINVWRTVRSLHNLSWTGLFRVVPVHFHWNIRLLPARPSPLGAWEWTSATWAFP
jgi:hypothetical protein